MPTDSSEQRKTKITGFFGVKKPMPKPAK